MKNRQLPVAGCQLIAACGLALLLNRAAPAAAPATRPALQQFSDESQILYQQVQQEVVRVETPMPNWMITMIQQDNPMIKWGQLLDAQVRRQLAAEANAPHPLSAEVAPVNRESTNSEDQRRAIERFAAAHITGKVSTSGLILDDQGHVLIPLDLEKDAASKGPIMIYTPTGTTSAHFVGSDLQSHLTVVQMDKPIGHAAQFADHRPRIGSLVMVLSPNQSAAQIVVWTGNMQNFGILSNMDGQIAGIMRMGEFLSPHSFTSITRQLIDTGTFKRAQLGVFISELNSDDPRRPSTPALGNRPAIFVNRVVAGSAADKARIQKGDLILQLAGHDIDDLFSFTTAIANCSGPTDLQILRNGKLVDTHVVLKPQ